MTKKILVIGSINADTFIEIDRLPKQGETIASSKHNTGFTTPGGKGANQAAACGNLGVSTSFICRFGNDFHVSNLQKILNSFHVDYSASSTVDCPSGQAFIFLEPNGENSIVIVGGANSVWPNELNENEKNCIKSSHIILLQREIPDAFNQLVMKYAFQYNIPIMLDLGGQDTPLSHEILKYCTYICPNETELSRITKLPTNTKEELFHAARIFQEKGNFHVLLTIGEKGSYFIPNDKNKEIIYQECIKTSNVIDTTGAGDCFRAAFASCLMNEQSISQCMYYAAVASSLCIQVKGSLISMPSHSLVVQHL